MKIRLLTQMKLTRQIGTIEAGPMHEAGLEAEVPDHIGKVMVDAGEAVEIDAGAPEAVPPPVAAQPEPKAAEEDDDEVLARVRSASKKA